MTFKKYTKEEKEEIWIWLTHLWAETYPKGRFKLQTGNTYCCLGVACKVLIPNDKIVKYNSTSKVISGELPLDQHYSPLWLKTINHYVNQITGIKLTKLNDVYDFSHPEIADIVYSIVFLENYTHF